MDEHAVPRERTVGASPQVDDDRRSLLFVHLFSLDSMAGTTVVLRALLDEVAVEHRRVLARYLDLSKHPTPRSTVGRLLPIDGDGHAVVGVNLHVGRHWDRVLECFELCRGRGLSIYVWIHDYWPHHEASVRTLIEEFGVTLLASTQFVGRDLAEAGFSAEVVPVGISRSNIVENSPGLLRTDVFVVGSAGRLVPRKRHLDVIRAFARATLDPPARLQLRLAPSLVYSSAEDDAMFAELSRAASGIIDEGRVVVLDREVTPRHDYHAYSVYVCASSYEGFSMTPIEAVDSGCPALMSDIPAHREIATAVYRDQADEMLFPPGDVDALADHLLDEARTSRRRTALTARSQEIRAIVDARWSPRTTAQSLLDVLDAGRRRS